MSRLDDIKAPLGDFFDRVRKSYSDALESKSEWLIKAVEILDNSMGKQVRPLFAGLIASCCAGATDKTIEASNLLELIHTATLIHDDVIDESLMRRGVPTLNNVFGNTAAVLMGDFVLSSALLRAISLGDMRIVALISEVGRDLAEGEIRQMEEAKAKNPREVAYFDVIKKKTAELFRIAGILGVITSQGAKTEDEQIAAQIGLSIGYAFQIRDDIFDYLGEDVGKPIGLDLKEGKVTLPLIYALDSAPKEDQDEAKAIIKRGEMTEDDIRWLTSFALRNGGVEYARKKMNEYVREAIHLTENFPSSTYRDALILLIEFIANRTK